MRGENYVDCLSITIGADLLEKHIRLALGTNELNTSKGFPCRKRCDCQVILTTCRKRIDCDFMIKLSDVRREIIVVPCHLHIVSFSWPNFGDVY